MNDYAEDYTKSGVDGLRTACRIGRGMLSETADEKAPRPGPALAADPAEAGVEQTTTAADPSATKG